MKKFLFSIKTRLLGLTVGITLFYVLLGLFAFQFFNKIEYYTDLSKPIERFSQGMMLIQTAQKDFLLVETGNVDFFETGKSPYVEIFDKNFNRNKRELSTLLKNDFLNELTDGKLLERLNATEKDLNTYNELFHELVNKTKERGYLQYGISGQLKTDGDNLMLQVSAFKNKGLNEMVKELRNTEIEYLLRKAPKYTNKIISITENYIDKMAQDSSFVHLLKLSSGEKASLSKELREYAELAAKLLEKDQKIGITIKQGLLNKLLKTNQKIEKQINWISKQLTTVGEKEVADAKSALVLLLVVFSLLTILLLSFLQQSISKPLHELKNFVWELEKGKLPETKTDVEYDEISAMQTSLNTFVNHLKEKTSFASEIRKGNLSAHFEAVSSKDLLGFALLEMQASLQNAINEEKQRLEDDKKRNWITTGTHKMSEVLRRHLPIDQLANEILSNLILYIEAHVGALFIYHAENKEDAYLELMAAVALDKEKYLKKRVHLKDGLVGTCALERRTIYMTDIPSDYIQITSGLGDARPRSLLIVPLETNEELFGIIEIASVTVLEKHVVQFVEQISESIAAVLAGMRTTTQTAKLLQQSKRQAEELSSQEEEMRQNLEELQATKEEAVRKENYLNSIIQSIDLSTYMIEYDLDGVIMKVNSVVEEKMGLTADQLIGSHHRNYLGQSNDFNTEEYEAFWSSLREGKTSRKTCRKIIDGRALWLLETYTPIYDVYGDLVRILNLATDITDEKKTLDSIVKHNLELENTTHELEQREEALIAEMKKNLQEGNFFRLFYAGMQKHIFAVLISRNGTIEDVSIQLHDRLDRKKASIVGQSVVSFMNFATEKYHLLAEEVHKGKMVRQKVVIEHQLGRKFTFEAFFIPIPKKSKPDKILAFWL